MCILIICFLIDDVINVEINLCYQAVFLYDQKLLDKNWNIVRKELLEEAFFLEEAL